MRAVGADCFASQNIPTERREGDKRVLFPREYDCIALIFRASHFRLRRGPDRYLIRNHHLWIGHR